MAELLLPYRHRPACTEAQARALGYWLAQDDAGYEYVVGAHVTKTEAGTMDPDGNRRAWDFAEGRWTERPRADAPRHEWRPGGKPLDRGDRSRASAIRDLRAFVDAACNGSRESLWIYGDRGRGKDALSACILADLTNAGAKCVSVRWGDLVSGIRRSYLDGKREWSARLDEVTAAAVLHVADVQPHESEDVRTLLFDLVDVRGMAGRITVATSNLAPEAWTTVDPRIASRLSGWQRVLLTGRDYRADR